VPQDGFSERDAATIVPWWPDSSWTFLSIWQERGNPLLYRLTEVIPQQCLAMEQEPGLLLARQLLFDAFANPRSNSLPNGGDKRIQ
jgi:hypothetical protein